VDVQERDAVVAVLSDLLVPACRLKHVSCWCLTDDVRDDNLPEIVYEDDGSHHE